ncbi:hypothetical protein CRE_01429 [Caenorhabditis remanei]|uniref:Uncharacterized protein n=1 Tax=Caenorhabditis remanei TaxID=31234 RepID=E3NLD6_CAERE|nr:hypothetical protein CRE_01429 [Caenorhabditis remanei]
MNVSKSVEFLMEPSTNNSFKEDEKTSAVEAASPMKKTMINGELKNTDSCSDLGISDTSGVSCLDSTTSETSLNLESMSSNCGMFNESGDSYWNNEGNDGYDGDKENDSGDDDCIDNEQEMFDENPLQMFSMMAHLFAKQ